jgi:hypothetical protein
MAAAMAPPFEEDMSESGSEAATDRPSSGTTAVETGQAGPASVTESGFKCEEFDPFASTQRCSQKSAYHLRRRRASCYTDRSSEEARMFICELHSTMMDDIRLEFERMNKSMNVEKSIKFQQSLLSFATGAEFFE